MFLYILSSKPVRRRQETTLIKKNDVVLKSFKPIAINIRAETTKIAPLSCLDEDIERLICKFLAIIRQNGYFLIDYEENVPQIRSASILKG